MKPCEAIACRMLENWGLAPVYEPLGPSTTPDFAIAGNIAVEVRRLNQNHDSGGGMKGLEETEIPLYQMVRSIAQTFGPDENESWVLTLRFSRPLAPFREIKQLIHTELTNFRNSTCRSDCTLHINDNIKLVVTRAEKVLHQFFLLGFSIDEDSGGFVVGEMEKNIVYAADTKRLKVDPVRSMYNAWWLVLVDYIGFGIDQYDIGQLQSVVQRPDGWDRVIIVSPHDPDHNFVV